MVFCFPSNYLSAGWYLWSSLHDQGSFPITLLTFSKKIAKDMVDHFHLLLDQFGVELACLDDGTNRMLFVLSLTENTFVFILYST